MSELCMMNTDTRLRVQAANSLTLKLGKLKLVRQFGIVLNSGRKKKLYSIIVSTLLGTRMYISNGSDNYYSYCHCFSDEHISAL